MAVGNTSSTLQVQAQSSVSDLPHRYVNSQHDAHVDAIASDAFCIHHDVCIQMQRIACGCYNINFTSPVTHS